MKFLPGHILLALVICLPLGADPVKSYIRVNGKMVVTLQNQDPIPYYCKIVYEDGTVDRKVLLPNTSMQANKFKKVSETVCT